MVAAFTYLQVFIKLGEMSGVLAASVHTVLKPRLDDRFAQVLSASRDQGVSMFRAKKAAQTSENGCNLYLNDFCYWRYCQAIDEFCKTASERLSGL